MTRIISGAASATRLEVPRHGTRPTSDRVREAIFSTLDAWDALEGSRVLDLYAGTGALGLEAASRGAREVTLVEKDPKAASVTHRNAQTVERALRRILTPDAAATTGASCAISSIRRSARTYLLEAAPQGARWDLAFLDPPYEHPDAELAEVLAALAPLLRPRAIVMVERSSRSLTPQWPELITPIRDRRYGETTIWWAETPETEGATGT